MLDSSSSVAQKSGGTSFCSWWKRHLRARAVPGENWCGVVERESQVDGWVDGWMYGWVSKQMEGWMDGWISGQMDGCIVGWIMNGWGDGWMNG